MVNQLSTPTGAREMGHKVIVVTLPFGRLSVEVCSAPHFAAKAIWECRFGSASIPPRTEPTSALRCSITSEPRCCIALDSTVC